MYLNDYNDIEFSELENDLSDIADLELGIFRKISSGIKNVYNRLKPAVSRIISKPQQISVPRPQLAPSVAPNIAPIPEPVITIQQPIQPVQTRVRPFYLNPFFIGGVGLAIIILILVLKKRKQSQQIQTLPVERTI